MFRIPRRFNYLVFGVIQSGMTCAVAAAIASFPLSTAFVGHWLRSWLMSWLIMVPVVVVATPLIHSPFYAIVMPAQVQPVIVHG